MSLEKELHKRSGSVCELCGSPEHLKIFYVPPVSTEDISNVILACGTCIDGIEDVEKTDPDHWRCLNTSMWSEHKPVQVIAWRMLTRLKDEGWPQDLLDMMYLDEDTMVWAKTTGEGEDKVEKIVHKDINGAVLQAGDSVVLIKDLKVKGSSMVAKQGTAVRRITLDPDNSEYIEGKVDGQQIVIITKFVKKI